MYNLSKIPKEVTMKKRPHTQRLIFNLILTLLLLTIATCGSIIVFSKSFDYTFNMIEEDQKRSTLPTVHTLQLKIDEQTSSEALAKLLYDKHFIGNAFWFRVQAKLSHLEDFLMPGTYTINSNMTNHDIVKLLTTDPSDLEEIQFTIPEGFTIMQIANRLEDKDIISKEDFLNAVENRSYAYDFLEALPEGTSYKLEGYLFPDTYRIHKNATAEEIVTMMLNRFEEIVSHYTQYLYDSNYSLHDIVTIASIIEREAKLEEERPLISGVIYNRLNQNMKLQMCSTVQYARGEQKKMLTYEELALDSPYNTYIHEGLPVGAICSPGESSLRAAFSPEEHDYYYFVLEDASIGAHAFSKTADEHSLYKERYKQSQDINFVD